MAQSYKVDEDRSRLLARFVRQVLVEAADTGDEIESLSDLVTRLKIVCARLHVGWTNDDIDNALRIVASNVPLPGATAIELARQRRAAPRRPEPRNISRAEASAILHRLGIRL